MSNTENAQARPAGKRGSRKRWESSSVTKGPQERHGGRSPTDQRIESFLIDVLALAGEDPDAVREGVRVALANWEKILRADEVNKRMKDRAAHACRALCRARVAEEMQRRKGTRIAEHLKLVLSVMDRQER